MVCECIDGNDLLGTTMIQYVSEPPWEHIDQQKVSETLSYGKKPLLLQLANHLFAFSVPSCGASSLKVFETLIALSVPSLATATGSHSGPIRARRKKSSRRNAGFCWRCSTSETEVSLKSFSSASSHWVYGTSGTPNSDAIGSMRDVNVTARGWARWSV